LLIRRREAVLRAHRPTANQVPKICLCQDEAILAVSLEPPGGSPASAGDRQRQLAAL
jgi:anti-sigma-K factor RskA